MGKNSFIEKTYLELPRRALRQFQCVPTAYEGCSRNTWKSLITTVTENMEENCLEIYIFQVLCPLSLPLLNIPNSQSVLKFLSLYCKLFIFE